MTGEVLLAETVNQGVFHDDYKKINEEIKRLELMIKENCQKIEDLHKCDAALKITIKLLKEKRHELIFFAMRVPER